MREMAFSSPKKEKFLGWGGGGGSVGGILPDPLAPRAFGGPWTFSTVRTPRKMHATPLGERKNKQNVFAIFVSFLV